jgi:hypothetical protein
MGGSGAAPVVLELAHAGCGGLQRLTVAPVRLHVGQWSPRARIRSTANGLRCAEAMAFSPLAQRDQQREQFLAGGVSTYSW